jgi:single-strand DNA-binding protein
MLIGNLTRDPEVRFTPKGSAVSDLGIAVNRTYVTDSGEKMQETTYVDVVVWSRLAELAGQYLHKGSPVFIEGRLQMDTWEDKATGQKRSKIRVVADNLQFLGRREGGEDGGPPMGGGNGGGYQQASPPQRSSNFSRPASGPPQRQSPPPRQAQNDEFGDGPITDGLDDDEIPF